MTKFTHRWPPGSRCKWQVGSKLWAKYNARHVVVEVQNSKLYFTYLWLVYGRHSSDTAREGLEAQRFPIAWKRTGSAPGVSIIPSDYHFCFV